MTLPPPNACRRIRQLFRLLESSNPNEASNARDKLERLLAKWNLKWEDIDACIAIANEDDERRAREAAADRASGTTAPTAADDDGSRINVLDLVLRLIELHIDITSDERTAVALWILHSHVFGRFAITPRLALLSPVRGCGKTTLLALLSMLCSDSYKDDNITPAAIYHLLGTREYTLLLDEGDNLGLFTNSVLRSVFNAGHRRGGSITRFISGRPRRYSVFAPLATAAIGTLPLPLMHRSVIVNMQRHPPGSPTLQRLDEFDPTFPKVRALLQRWASHCKLDPDPELPPGLHNRTADNWRVMLAIADDLKYGADGVRHDQMARAAAVALSAYMLEEDPAVVALSDIRHVFDERGVDRITSADLVAALHALDSLWLDWRGVKDDRPPHQLNQSELARLLRPFGIRTRPIWPKPRRRSDKHVKSARGYWRSDFEGAWRAYVSGGVTPSHGGKVTYLRRKG
jgi:Protein of unknown function (DUF3631)